MSKKHQLVEESDDTRSTGKSMRYRHDGHISHKQLKLFAGQAKSKDEKRIFTNMIKRRHAR